MRKFIYKAGQNKTVIYECNVSLVRPKPFNLKHGEEQYAIEAPAKLKEILPSSFSFFFSDTKDECFASYKEAVIGTFESAKLTRGMEYTEQDIEAKMAAVEYIPF